MRVINENLATRRLAWRECDDETGDVVASHEVEFAEDGSAEVDDELGETLVERYEPVREATGPDDHAADYEAPPEVKASGAARELAEEEGVDLSEIEPTGGADGDLVTVDDVRAALEG